MKKQKAKIFSLLKKIIIDCETDIHEQMKVDGTSTHTIKCHSKVIKELKKCSTIKELLIIMNVHFSMDYTDVMETYII